jgi:hypothetical protein
MCVKIHKSRHENRPRIQATAVNNRPPSRSSPRVSRGRRAGNYFPDNTVFDNQGPKKIRPFINNPKIPQYHNSSLSIPYSLLPAT